MMRDARLHAWGAALTGALLACPAAATSAVADLGDQDRDIANQCIGCHAPETPPPAQVTLTAPEAVAPGARFTASVLFEPGTYAARRTIVALVDGNYGAPEPFYVVGDANQNDPAVNSVLIAPTAANSTLDWELTAPATEGSYTLRAVASSIAGGANTAVGPAVTVRVQVGDVDAGPVDAGPVQDAGPVDAGRGKVDSGIPALDGGYAIPRPNTAGGTGCGQSNAAGWAGVFALLLAGLGLRRRV